MFKKIKNFLLNILGDIKVYKYPFFMVYDPSTYFVKGHHTRQAIDIIEPGAVLLRKYINYADGLFIPGKFSHSAIYIGDGRVIHAVAEGVQVIDIIDFLRCDGFCILKPRDEEIAEKAISRAKQQLEKPYDFDFIDGENAFYCHELTAYCYQEYDIKKQNIKILGIKLKQRYTCDSFLTNENFENILEIIPYKNVNFTLRKH